MQNLKLFSSISFSFGPVYYSVVTLPTLWSDEKSTFLAASRPGFYLHSAIRVIWHKFLSTMTQTRELLCLKTNLVKTSQCWFSAKSMTALTRWLHTFSPAPVTREGRNKQSGTRGRRGALGLAAALPHPSGTVCGAAMINFKAKMRFTQGFVVQNVPVGALSRGKYIRKGSVCRTPVLAWTRPVLWGRWQVWWLQGLPAGEA